MLSFHHCYKNGRLQNELKISRKLSQNGSLLDTVLGVVIAIFRGPKNGPAFDSAILGDSEVRGWGDLIL